MTISAFKLSDAALDQVSGGGSRSRLGGGIFGGGELEMIQLQSLISQRQMAIQVTSNMMTSLQGSMKAVIHNIGS